MLKGEMLAQLGNRLGCLEEGRREKPQQDEEGEEDEVNHDKNGEDRQDSYLGRHDEGKHGKDATSLSQGLKDG